MRFSTAMLSEKGGREVNQDYCDFLVVRDRGIWALADGLGGSQGGEIAARLSVQTMLEQVDEEPILLIKGGLAEAQRLLHEEQKRSPLRRSMRTTLVVLVCSGASAYWAHVGDSRLYHFRAGKLISQTKDHSVCQALVNAGEISQEDIRFHEDRNRLYRVLGTEGEVKASIREDGIQIEQGDAFLLCSDGFWEYVTEDEMVRTIESASSPSEWLEAMESILKSRVLERHDNYSALAVFVEKNTTM